MMILSSLMLVLNPILVEANFDINFRVLNDKFYFHISKIAFGHGYNFGYVDLLKDIMTDMRDKVENVVYVTDGGVKGIDGDTMVCYLTGYIINVKPG